MDKNVTGLEERIDRRKVESKVRTWSMILVSSTEPFPLETRDPMEEAAGHDPGPDDEAERLGR